MTSWPGMGKKVLLFILLGFLCLPVLGQSFLTYPTHWDNYLVNNYLPEDGLIVEQIQYVIEDDAGFIWIVTAGGVIRYDGLTFKPYRKGLDRGYFYELHADAEGNLWAPASAEGIYKIVSDSLVKYKDELDMTGGIAKTVLISRDNLMYVGIYGDGLFVFDGEKTIQKYTPEDGLVGPNIWRIVEDKQGRIWIGTDEGLSIFDNGKFTNFTTENGLPYNAIRGLTEMYNGDIWVGTDKEGVVVFREDKPHTYYHKKDGLTGLFPQFFAQNPADSSIWIADHGTGIHRFKDGVFENINTETGLVNDFALFVGFSKSGSAYVGTERGMSVFKPRKIDIIDKRIPGIAIDSYISVIEDSEQTLWLGSDGAGWNYFSNGTWNTIENPPSKTNGYANGGAIGADGTPWFATQGSGIFNVKKDRTIGSVLTTEQGLSSNMVQGIEFDDAEQLYVCSVSGVNVFNTNLELSATYNSENQMEHEYCSTSFSDSNNAIWFGTYGGGLYRFYENEVTHFDTSSGLSHPIVYTILEHSSGKLLVGTSRGGLNVFNGEGFDFFGQEKGFPDFAAYGMTEDLDGNLWISSNDGIYKITKADIAKLVAGNDQKIAYTMFSTEDGLATNAMEAGTNALALTLHSGEMLFPTSGGVAVVNPEKAIINTQSFYPYIDELYVNEKQVDLNSNLTFAPDKNKVELIYSALNHESPRKTSFRIKLSNVDDDWVYVGNRTTAYYDFLPDGNYTFTVSAKGPDGQWSDKTATLDFTVLPPFYKTWWFIGLCMLGFIGVGAGGVYWRSNQKLKALNRELETQQKIQEERERISRELHDNVGSQISNLITGIEISNLHVKNNQQDKALSLLGNLDNDARGAMTDLRETIWLLDKEKVEFGIFLDHLNGYLKRQQRYLKELKVEVSSSVNPQLILSPDRSLNLTRIVQEALNNTNKYAKASVFRITCSETNGKVRIVLKDDGIGMDAEAQTGSGNGLVNMHERVKMMDASIFIESKKGVGTTITLEFA
ncbi:MAG: histidine kinase [bacterium]|nr:histidine kinase [bacterium]